MLGSGSRVMGDVNPITSGNTGALGYLPIQAKEKNETAKIVLFEAYV